jgi:hypothetical protein
MRSFAAEAHHVGRTNGGIVVSLGLRLVAASALASALLCAACVSQPAAPQRPAGVQPPAPASTLVPDGSEYLLQTWTGSGFFARLHLVRQEPSASGFATVTVGVRILPGTDSRFGALIVGATRYQFAAAALTLTGTIDLGGTLQTPSSLKGGEYSSEEFGDVLAVPGNTESLRFTLHMGLTKAAALEGTSVVIPLSVIPMVKMPQPFVGMTPAYGGHVVSATPGSQ